MYCISYVKCVLCFLFLVILAFLSCTGFRIDNLEMTDISKRSTQIDSSYKLRGLYDLKMQDPSRHRVRHHHNRTRRVKTTPVAAPQALRAQRSPGRANRGRQRGALEQAIAWKSYLSDVVVRARAESKTYAQETNCSVMFKVVERVKMGAVVDDSLRLEFLRQGQSCAVLDVPARPERRVPVNVRVSKEYFLFLKVEDRHSYQLIGTPVLAKKNKNRQIRNAIESVVGQNFRLKKTRVEVKFSNNRARRKLVCQVWGFPTPYISWEFNNSTISTTNKSVKYRKKKSTSTLMLKRHGTYKCIARGLDYTKVKEIRIPSRGEPCEADKQNYCYHRGVCYTRNEGKEHGCECPPEFTGDRCQSKSTHDREACKAEMQNYCENRGVCFFIPSLTEYGCECKDEFSGKRCETKTSHFSTYGQTSTYTCKLGLSTKLYC